MDLLIVIVTIFGFVGLAAVALIPIRSLQLVMWLWGCSSHTWGGRGVATVFALFVLVILYFEISVVAGVFSCLTGDYCGPSRASGWQKLASIGVWYVCLELVGLVLKAVFAGNARKKRLRIP
jgi:hypothetical protein